jgi:FkbM family methyltransferase
MIAAKKVSPTGKVIAIEPDPENCNLLKQNVGLNRKGYFMGVYALIFLL